MCLKEKIESAFSKANTNSCITIFNFSSFWVFDNEVTERTELSTATSRKDVLIENKKKKNISLVSIDGCVFTTENHKRCDFAVFDNNKICFCEIKQGKNSKARTQLLESIKLFKSKIDFKSLGYKIEAYRCQNLKNYNSKKPSITATDMNNMVLFAKIGVKPFYSGNTIRFD